MSNSSSQKFISRNRPPRVQITYDLQADGGTLKKELPFVVGMMGDLSGKPADALPDVGKREFSEIDSDNFNDTLKAARPRVAFHVPNTLTGEGNMAVDITFESMDDFSPAAVVRKVEGLKQLLETRTQLANLLTYMDGKSGAENLINNLLENPELLKAMTSTPKPKDETAGA